MSRYRHDYTAFSTEVLNADFMVAEMARRARLVGEQAEATAPEETGEYRSSFDLSYGKHGGLFGDRAYGRVENNDPAAVSIEFGTNELIGIEASDQGEDADARRGTPAHYTLTRALDAARD